MELQCRFLSELSSGIRIIAVYGLLSRVLFFSRVFCRAASGGREGMVSFWTAASKRVRALSWPPASLPWAPSALCWFFPSLLPASGVSGHEEKPACAGAAWGLHPARLKGAGSEGDPGAEGPGTPGWRLLPQTTGGTGPAWLLPGSRDLREGSRLA